VHRNTLSKKMKEFGIEKGRRGEISIGAVPIKRAV